MGSFEETFLESKPYKCVNCQGKMFYTGSGEYKCQNCGSVAYDAYGKVRKFLDEYGSQPMPVITEATGVPAEVLNVLLKNGYLQLPNNSKMFLKCEKCGCSLRYGRYCPDCAVETFRSVQGLFSNEVGEKAKPLYGRAEEKKEVAARMRFLDRKL